MSRRHAAAPTDVVVGFCLATAVLAAVCHLALEQTQWPQTSGQWLAVLGLGVGSYLAPLLSTAFLMLAGYATPSVWLGLAAVLITGGGVLAAKDMIPRKS